MKKKIILFGIIIIMIMAVAIISNPTKVFAGNGPYEDIYGDPGACGWLYFIDEDDSEKIMYSKTTQANNGQKGAIYDKKTNTLTLNNLQGKNLILKALRMGDDFKIKLVGKNYLKQIISDGDEHGGSISILGNGSLEIASNDEVYAIQMYCRGGSDSLYFGATVKLYNRHGVIGIYGSPFKDIKNAIVLPNFTFYPDSSYETKINENNKKLYDHLYKSTNLEIKKPAKDISTLTLNIDTKNVAYTGSSIIKNIKIKDNNYILKEGTDYDYICENDFYIGKATIIIDGKRNYFGRIKKSFIIYPQAPTNLRATKQDKNSITIGWNKPESGARAYRIYMYNSSKKQWEYKLTTDKTSTTITGLNPSTAYIFKVCAYVKVDDKLYRGEFTPNLTTATAPVTPTIKSIAKTGSNTKKQLKVTWSKSENASGYEIAMYTSKTKSWSKIDIKYASNISKVYSNLAKDKITYKFKVRAYKTVNGKKVYSQYSAIKSIYY